MSQLEEGSEDVKPKLSLTINCEGQRESLGPLASCSTHHTDTEITVKVKSHMPFRKIFETIEVRVAAIPYGRLDPCALQKRFGKEPGRSRSWTANAVLTLSAQGRSDLYIKGPDYEQKIRLKLCGVVGSS